MPSRFAVLSQLPTVYSGLSGSCIYMSALLIDFVIFLTVSCLPSFQGAVSAYLRSPVFPRVANCLSNVRLAVISACHRTRSIPVSWSPLPCLDPMLALVPSEYFASTPKAPRPTKAAGLNRCGLSCLCKIFWFVNISLIITC